MNIIKGHPANEIHKQKNCRWGSPEGMQAGDRKQGIYKAWPNDMSDNMMQQNHHESNSNIVQSLSCVTHTQLATMNGIVIINK